MHSPIRSSLHNLSQIESFLEQGAAIRKSDGTWLVGWGQFEFSEKPLRGGICFYHSDFFLATKSPWVQPQYFDIIPSQEFLTNFKSCPTQQLPWDFCQPNFCDFLSQFHYTLSLISRGDIQKIVPVVFESSTRVPGPSEIYQFLSATNSLKNSFRPYGIWFKQKGIFGVTPEVLFRNESYNISTMALAGTSVSGDTDFFHDPKERFEHQIVVQEIKKKLSNLGSLKINDIEVFDLGNIQHLLTQIDLSPHSNLSFEELIKLLHPTPALGGSPTQKALQILKRLDCGQRNSFGAPFGYSLSENEFEALVAIRNIQWQDGKSLLGSGCGLVKQSKVDKEWNELKLKRNSFKSIIGINESMGEL